MLRAVLFDLDGTLLDIELDSFLQEYFSVLGPTIARLSTSAVTARQAIDAVLQGTHAMNGPHPGRSNQQVFFSRFQELTAIDLAETAAADAIEAFYRDVFPRLRHGAKPQPGGALAVAAARESGLATALATNPIFPLAAIRERARWAELDVGWFDHVTSFEVSTACKPLPQYFLEIAGRLGVAPSECLMVGDDPSLDLPASAVGMGTFLVGSGGAAHTRADGSLFDLADRLRQLPDVALGSTYSQ